MEKSKTNEVIKYLFRHGSITQMEAAKYFNLYRLGSVIHVLRKRGMNINTELIPFKSKYGTHGNYARYHLIGE